MMLYDVLWCCMMLYDVIAVDFIPELCVFQLNAELKPSYIPRCGIFLKYLARKNTRTKFRILAKNNTSYQGFLFIKVGKNKSSKIGN